MLRIHRLMQVDTGLAAPESIQSPQLYWNPNHACVSAYSFGVRFPEGMLTTPSYQVHIGTEKTGQCPGKRSYSIAAGKLARCRLRITYRV
jgi:hypothetical protein